MIARFILILLLTTTMATADTSSRNIAYNPAQFNLLHKFEGHSNWVWEIAFDPAERHLLSASGDKTLRYWNIRKKETVYVFGGHGSYVYGVDVSPDGKSAVSTAADKSMILWDLTTGAEKNRVSLTSAGRSVFFDKDGQSLITADNSGMVEKWSEGAATSDSRFGESIRGFRRLKCTPDRKLAVLGGRGGVHIWDLKNEKRLHKIDVDGSSILDIAISPKGDFIAYGSQKGTHVWNRSKEEHTQHLPTDNKYPTAMTFTPDGRYLLIADYQGRIHVWDWRRDKVLSVFNTREKGIWGISCSRSGRYFAASGNKGMVFLFGPGGN